MAKPKTAGHILAPAVPVDQRKIRFSFEYLQADHLKFQLADCDRSYFESLFREILRYQTYTLDQFKAPSPADRRHFIHFPNTTEPEWFPGIDPADDENLWTEDCWQFGLPGQAGGSTWRVHGFISEEVFHVVWFDPFHRLDP